MAAKSTSFFAPNQQQASIKRQNALAQTLMQQGQQTDPNASVSGIVIKQNPLGQLARALTQGAAGYIGGQADREEADLNNQRSQRLGAAINKYGTDPLGASTDLVSDPNTADLGMQLYTNKVNTDMLAQKESADLQKQLAIAQFKSQNPGASNIASTIQIANEIQKARKAGDMQRVNDLTLSGKLYEKGITGDGNGGVTEIGGYSPTISGIEGAKSGAKEQAQKNVDLTMNPQIEAATDIAKSNANTSVSDQKALPIVDQLSKLNGDTLDVPYVDKVQGAARFIPSLEKQTTALDLMQQARLGAAAPLAKQLGVNPTDKDFQASLDQIFNMSSTKAARQAQIDALETRIRARQGGVQATQNIQEGTQATGPNGQVLVSRGGKWVPLQ